MCSPVAQEEEKTVADVEKLATIKGADNFSKLSMIDKEIRLTKFQFLNQICLKMSRSLCRTKNIIDIFGWHQLHYIKYGRKKKSIHKTLNLSTCSDSSTNTQQKLVFVEHPSAQASLAVIGIIAFPSGRNKGKIISFTFTGDEFTRSPPVVPRLPSRNVRNVFLSLSQSAPIELMFGAVWDKCTIIMWM